MYPLFKSSKASQERLKPSLYENQEEFDGAQILPVCLKA